MKRKIIGILLALVIIAISLTACNLGSDSDSESPSGEYYKNNAIVVYDEGAQSKYVFAANQYAHTRVYSKPDYFMEGIYDSPTGGTKYFDELGTSLQCWKNDGTMPTTFYTRYAPIDGLHSTSEILYEDATFTSWYTTCEYIPPKSIVSAAKGNLNRYVEINIQFKTKDEVSDSCYIYLKDSTESSATESQSCHITPTSKYEQYSVSFKVPARFMKTGELIVVFNRTNNFKFGYFKDVVIDIMFTDEVE